MQQKNIVNQVNVKHDIKTCITMKYLAIHIHSLIFFKCDPVNRVEINFQTQSNSNLKAVQKFPSVRSLHNR